MRHGEIRIQFERLRKGRQLGEFLLAAGLAV